ncbi:thiol-disulfide oxidoreductase DCC family protein [Streptomyces sp. NPDC020379]|uniref:thiol-disulfide oxidoreductase DCC family protein n=1 Tax=Streptomyces sp. NPDC020379 TaxID=3365071 RepID=UPI0037BD2CCA
MNTPATTADRGAERAPVRRLTVLYDDRCPLCSFLRDWLVRQRQLVPLDLVPVGSPEARSRFPHLDHAAAFEEITVVGDGGQVYRGPAAWVVCLWALAEYRPLSHRLSTPSGMRLARGAVLTAAKYRGAQWRQRTGRAGGGAHDGRDGWVYSPAAGWAYVAPASTAVPAAPAACDSGCATPD